MRSKEGEQSNLKIVAYNEFFFLTLLWLCSPNKNVRFKNKHSTCMDKLISGKIN